MTLSETSMPVPTRVELFPDRVIKHFSNSEDFQRELDVYQKGIESVPTLLGFHTPQSITIERIRSIPYLDVKPYFSVILLANAISALHASTVIQGRCLCHIDNQPKNILATSKRYYLIDFTDSKVDYPEADISHLMLFWAEEFSLQEMNTFCTSFLQNYSVPIKLDGQRWTECMKSSIARFDERRRKFRSKDISEINPVSEANKEHLFTLAALL